MQRSMQDAIAWAMHGAGVQRKITARSELDFPSTCIGVAPDVEAPRCAVFCSRRTLRPASQVPRLTSAHLELALLSCELNVRRFKMRPVVSRRPRLALKTGAHKVGVTSSGGRWLRGVEIALETAE